MALLEILRKVSADAGFKDIDLNADIKAYLVDKINEAAEELYETTDMPGCLRECYVRVPANKQIALPPFIGKLRAIRSTALLWPISLRDLRPRYHYEPWKDMWNNWRFIGYSPIESTITNSAPFTYTIAVADSALYVDTVGSTIDSKRVTERVTMSSTSVVGTLSLNYVESIKVNKLANHDLTINDADGTQVAILYNDQLESRYAWYDVSQYPSIGECSDGRFVIEVLYKLPLQKFSNNTDTFPVPDYDNIIARKTIQLILEREEGKEQKAILEHTKVRELMKNKSNDSTGTLEASFLIEPHPLLGMFRSGRYRHRRSSKC